MQQWSTSGALDVRLFSSLFLRVVCGPAKVFGKFFDDWYHCFDARHLRSPQVGRAGRSAILGMGPVVLVCKFRAAWPLLILPALTIVYVVGRPVGIFTGRGVEALLATTSARNGPIL